MMISVGQRVGRWGRVVLVLLMIGGAFFLGAFFHLFQLSQKPNLVATQVGLPRPLLGSPYVPATLEFAGERVPLECVDVYESLVRELCVVANWHSSLLMAMNRSGRYFPTIERILKEEGIPDDMKYLAVAESTLHEWAVSPSGAVGIWQFIASTGKEYGLRIDDEVDERYHLEKATHAACRYLHKGYAKFGSWATTAGAFNMGQNGMRRSITRQGDDDYFNLHLNHETARYVYRILALKVVMEHPTLYNFAQNEGSQFQPLPLTEVSVGEGRHNLYQLARVYDSNYKLLKWVNPWLRDTVLTVKEGESITLCILPEKDRRTVHALREE